MKIKLIYVGRRRNNQGKMFHAFIDDKGGQHGFGGHFKYVYIGHTYEADKTKDDMTIATRPKQLDVTPIDDERAGQWRALERVAVQDLREENLRKKIDSMKDLLEEIPRIKRAMRGLNGADQQNFINWLWTEIDRENKERLRSEMNDMFAKKFKRLTKQLKKESKC